MMMWSCGNWNSFMGWHMSGGWLLAGLLIAIVIIFGFFFSYLFIKNQRPTTAFKILDESYAKGKISYQEYLTRKNNLKK